MFLQQKRKEPNPELWRPGEGSGYSLPGLLCCFFSPALHTVGRKHGAVASWEYVGHYCRLNNGYCCSLGWRTGRAVASATMEGGRGVV